jgi:hypothetical protein
MLITAMMVFIAILIGLLPGSVTDGWMGILIGIAAAAIGWGVMVSDWGRTK